MIDDNGGPALTVDRLVITGAAVTAERAERFRGLLEMELRRLLLQEGLSDGIRNATVRTLSAPEIALREPERDGAVAAAFARRLLHVLGGAG